MDFEFYGMGPLTHLKKRREFLNFSCQISINDFLKLSFSLWREHKKKYKTEIQAWMEERPQSILNNFTQQRFFSLHSKDSILHSTAVLTEDHRTLVLIIQTSWTELPFGIFKLLRLQTLKKRLQTLTLECNRFIQ